MMIGGMGVEAMPDRDWKRAFDEPIPLPVASFERCWMPAVMSPPSLSARKNARSGKR
jgi:hypothetical protein